MSSTRKKLPQGSVGKSQEHVLLRCWDEKLCSNFKWPIGDHSNSIWDQIFVASRFTLAILIIFTHHGCGLQWRQRWHFITVRTRGGGLARDNIIILETKDQVFDPEATKLNTQKVMYFNPVQFCHNNFKNSSTYVLLQSVLVLLIFLVHLLLWQEF